MKEQYKNFKVPDSYLEKQKELRHNLDLDNDNPSLETGIIITKLLKLVAVLGKRSVVQISDDDDKDEDVDDDLMDSKSNATEESPEEPNEREARVC
ncbi:uncharacterized protein OCT59_024513 [Rhizophagus irregularis]|uniref:uncharacterized protein n=1 Tax=Rhizophagus irregularis TaxID=588596 RepID=UPI003324D123|nr:hypothetical protein OCT59_024513 [Rhizophagus irregularis]